MENSGDETLRLGVLRNEVTHDSGPCRSDIGLLDAGIET
jgi:hypothetical protein